MQLGQLAQGGAVPGNMIGWNGLVWAASSTVTAFHGELNLPGATFKAVYNGNVGSGNIDLYTGATGKRTMVMSMSVYNTAVGAITCFPEVKIGGSYYRLQSISSTCNAGVSTPLNAAFFPIVLEPGDIIAISTSGVGLNVSLKLIEYPAALKVYSPRLTSFAASANTLYTVPANTSANILGVNGIFYGGYCNVTNGTGSNATYQIHTVPSGGSPGAGNQTDGLVISNGRGQSFECYQTMTAGDFIDVTSTVTTAGQFAWITVAETSN
jgi:hypothetical protein